MKKRFNLRHRSNYLTKLCVSLFLNKLFFATFWFNELSKIGVFNHRSKLKWGIHKPRRHSRGEKGIGLNLLNKTYSIKLFTSEGGIQEYPKICPRGLWMAQKHSVPIFYLLSGKSDSMRFLRVRPIHTFFRVNNKKRGPIHRQTKNFPQFYFY